MNSLSNNISNLMKDDPQQYASNDSGLSFNSNSVETDARNIPFQDSQHDDLAKSLFLNSISRTDIIQDDDIYSYKSKMEIGNFPKPFRSFSLAKTDNFNSKNSCNFQSIIHDVENLKFLEPFYQSKSPSSTNISCKKEVMNVPFSINTPIKFVDELKCDSRSEIKSKKSMKKNGIQEYTASSIKDYRGDKALNDIVTYIQGSTKTQKTSLKTKVNKSQSTKVDSFNTTTSSTVSTLELALTTDSGVVSDNNSSPGSKEISQSNIDADSGTLSSQFVSLNNSDEDSSQLLLLEDNFKQVLSKKQKKTSGQKLSIEVSSNKSQTKLESIPAIRENKQMPNKTKKNGRTKTQLKIKCSSNSILNSRESYRDFLSNQYDAFVKRFNTVY